MKFVFVFSLCEGVGFSLGLEELSGFGAAGAKRRFRAINANYTRARDLEFI